MRFRAECSPWVSSWAGRGCRAGAGRPGALVPLKLGIASADSMGNDVYVAVVIDFGSGSSTPSVSKCVPGAVDGPRLGRPPGGRRRSGQRRLQQLGSPLRHRQLSGERGAGLRPKCRERELRLLVVLARDVGILGLRTTDPPSSPYPARATTSKACGSRVDAPDNQRKRRGLAVRMRRSATRTTEVPPRAQSSLSTASTTTPRHPRLCTTTSAGGDFYPAPGSPTPPPRPRPHEAGRGRRARRPRPRPPRARPGAGKGGTVLSVDIPPRATSCRLGQLSLPPCAGGVHSPPPPHRLGGAVVVAVLGGFAFFRLRRRPAERVSRAPPRRRRRSLHPVAWWLSAAGLAICAMRTNNQFLLALIGPLPAS